MLGARRGGGGGGGGRPQLMPAPCHNVRPEALQLKVMNDIMIQDHLLQALQLKSMNAMIIGPPLAGFTAEGNQ